LAARALPFYAGKLLLPWPLTFIYPRVPPDAADPRAWLPALPVLAAAAAALLAWRRGVRGPALALAYFAGTLVPALGFVDVYPMRYSFVADHFQYLASLGPLALLAAAATRVRPSALSRFAAGSVLALLAALTWRQAGTYADAETLWRSTLERNPGAWIAHNNLAKLLSARGEDEAALEQIRLGLALPAGARAHDQMRLNLALVLGRLGRHEEALAEWSALHDATGRHALRLAAALERTGRVAEAEARHREAVAADPADEPLKALGMFLLRHGRPDEALEPLGRLLERRPDDDDSRMVLADACASAGRMTEALAHAQRALAGAQARGEARLAQLIRQRIEEWQAAER
jgi:tetratricopeptide (TPR) repeat protein